MNPTLDALELIHREAGYFAKTSVENGREHLTDLQIEHLIKMTSDVVMKIKLKNMEILN